MEIVGYVVVVILVVLAVAAVGRVLLALRRPSERPLLGRLVWSPVTLLDAALGAVALIGLAYGAGASVRAGVMAAGAVLGALGGVANELRRGDNQAFDRFVAQRGFEPWGRRRTFWRPWRRPRPEDSLVIPTGWHEAADDLVASLRKTLGGTVELDAVANGRIGRETSLVALAAAGDARQMVVWLDVRREGEIVVGPPPGLELRRPSRIEAHLDPPVVPRGRVAYASAGIAPAEVEAALRPLELPTRPVGKALGLRIASEGVLVTLERDLAEVVGIDELAGVAAQVATAMRSQTLKRTLITSPSATT